MWTKYDYLCTDCDALIEITTLVDIRRDEYASCPCGSNKAINIGVSDGNAPIITDVSKVTPRGLVKINTNPSPALHLSDQNATINYTTKEK